MDERATDSPMISVRRMHDGEERAVRALAERAFSRLESAFFSPPVHTLVAERDGQLLGAVAPTLFELPDKRRAGGIVWLMTDPKTRGLGVGGRLVEAALEYLKEHGCQEAFAGVEGYNTSSSNLFAARDFTIISPGEQFRRYGLLGTMALWLQTFRLGGDVGHFLWARPGAMRPDNPTLQWWTSTLVSALIFSLAVWRSSLAEGLSLAIIFGAAPVILALFGLREIVMRLAARSLGLSVRHRAWEAALPLSAGIAVIFGWFFPTPGSVYPQAGTWRYRNLVSKLGPMAFAGASAVLAFTWAAWALVRLGEPPLEIYEWLRAAHSAGQMLALFEVLLPFSIFVSFNGRRVWDWSRPAWAVLAIVTLALFLVAGL
jgi:GNAT superfamily N-acetyltransferase